MKRNRLCLAFAFTLLFAAALPVVAAPRDTMALTGNILAKGTFNLVASMSLGSVTLAPGEYKIIASDSQISFLLKNKIVAQAAIQWKDIERADSNAMVDDSGKIREIRFKGKGRSAVVE